MTEPPQPIQPPQPLNPLTLPLHGARLIEASAGTGKTWTIAALYLRLVLGHGMGHQSPALQPPDILVMTFTRAATRELADRIRARLAEAAAVLRGEREPADALLASLRDAYPLGDPRQQAASRAAQAAGAMDEAAIHTLDAWCQRVLREHALASGGALADEQLADEAALRLEAVRDVWRMQVYPLDEAGCAAWLAVFPTVEALAQAMSQCLPLLLEERADNGAGEPIADVISGWRQTLASHQQGWDERAQVLGDGLVALCEEPSPFNGNKLSAAKARTWCDALATWARSPGVHRPVLTDTARARLTPDGLTDALKKDRHVTVPPSVQALLQELADLHDALDALPSLKAHLLEYTAHTVARRVAELKRQQHLFGFADPLRQLDAALRGEGGEALRQRLLARYPVALIDEFQDTSPLQWRVFERLYLPRGLAQGTLLLIGDPKQSIYGFRGADIHSYLRARAATAGHHHALDTNHRSTAAVVGAVNQLFAQAEGRPGGAFAMVDAQGGPALPFHAVRAAGRAEQFVCQGQPVPALTLCYGPALRTVPDLRAHHAALAAEQIVAWLNDPACGFAEPGQPLRRLQPADIAVLVRGKSEAAAVRRALQARGVASMYLSDQASVFASPEAVDLWRWLRAVASPLDAARARAAYASPLLGLPWAELAAQVHDEAAWDARVDLLRELQPVWRRRGVLAMLRLALHRLGLPARLLAQGNAGPPQVSLTPVGGGLGAARPWGHSQPGGERSLTNLLHLAELLQGASLSGMGVGGEEALVRWLGERITEAQAGIGDGAGLGDERIVRLESDEGLVQVITVHKSKGLEYPVVLLPFAATGATTPAQERKTAVLSLVGEDGRRHAVFDPRPAHRTQARAERLQEDVRLLYVALTRARHALWLGVGLQKKPQTERHLLAGSALGHLLGATEDTETEAVAGLLRRAVGSADAVLVADELPPRRGRWQPSEAAALLAPVPAYTAAIDRDWAVGSYSSVVRGLGAASSTTRSVLADEVDALSEATGSSDEPADDGVAPASMDAPWHRFPRGALAGNFLHDQLQWLAEEGFDLLGTDAGQRALRRRCERAGHGERADDVLAWLDAVVRTPLPPLQAPLSALDALSAQARSAELEFWLPSAALDAPALDALCRRHLLPGVPRPALPARRLRGLLMGFADLVFEHAGRWWVLDYKSNALAGHDGGYRVPQLAGAMAAHRYDVQAALYLAALHRLLRQRLAGYDPARHLGGAVYLFLRGIRGPAQGCVWLPADPALLAGIDALLDGVDVGVEATA